MSCPTDNGRDGNSSSAGHGLTLCTVITGLLVGILSNTYYGLRIRANEGMSMVSGMLGSAIFKLLSPLTRTSFTRSENMLLITLATAAGCMPKTAGFVGRIPALEFLNGPGENGPIHIQFDNTVLWSLGLVFFDVMFASLFRK
ncbi:MAG: hypothetical protein M1829_003790 [Trizodia sp. TS-e1964]|nr:MAG: hypothetical protein M1829_003790 [Trizodia sp. TS-e1964]